MKSKRATEELFEARRMVLEAIGLEDGRPFTPHMTLAKGLEQTEFEALLAQLEQSDWHTGRWSMRVEQLGLMQGEAGEVAWRCISRIRLAG